VQINERIELFDRTSTIARDGQPSQEDILGASIHAVNPRVRREGSLQFTQEHSWSAAEITGELGALVRGVEFAPAIQGPLGKMTS
jgi:hypothetical protein